ncbi:MAG TPA: gliding motility-associated C-terminal domain-containing protein, partial [Bacteroidales bacterium]|nr:gliding motility-associated C-terminal domain-containing protein [Bacteroidales bacterium]
NTSSITVTPSSTTTYSVTGTTTAGCTGTATVSVTVNPLPTVTASASPAAICNGASSILTASGANTYNWSTGGNTASITVTPSSTTTYTVTGTTTAGCTSTASITINVIQSPVVDYSTTQSHCGQSDGNIMTNVTGGIPPYIYQWSNGANTSNLNNISAGNYTLTVSDSNGCSSYISIILSDAPMPQANFAPKPQITTIDDPIIYFENYSIGASSYQWDFGDGYSSTDYSPSHKYDLPGVYYVVLSVSDQYGCTDTVGGEIIIRDIFTIYLPNTFTPNENDLNDRYIIIGNNIDPSYFEMRIFNRWGKELFYTTDINQGWNGNFNGEPVPEGVYVVKVSFKILGFNEVKYIVKEIVVLR